MHDLVPIFTSSTSEKENDGNSDLLEVVLVSDVILMNCKTKKIDSKSGINEDHQKHQGDEVGDGWNNVNKSIKNDLDVFLRSDQSYNSHDSESSNDSGGSRNA